MKIKIIVFILFLVFGFNGRSIALENLSETELGNVTAQDGATFVLENFNFFLRSPGIEYLDDQAIPSTGNPHPNNRGSISFQDIIIHDGNMGPATIFSNLDWDIYSQTINNIGYNFAKFSFYNTKMNMDMEVKNIQLSPFLDGTGGGPKPFSIGGMYIDNISINQMNVFLGAQKYNTGIAGEIDLNMKIDKMTIDIMKPNYGSDPTKQITIDNLMVCGSFTGSEPWYDSTLPLAYTSTPGLWSDSKAETYSGGPNGNKAYKEQLLNANRWYPVPASWKPSGVFQIGDVANGKPLRIDFTVDNNYYIPFPYDIISGESTQDSRAEWYEAASGQLFSDDRGWKDGVDNYIADGTRYKPMKNPRYGKAFMSMDAPIKGSLRFGKTGGDIFIVDGINLQLHMEIPGYGYGDTPNSIPRPYPAPNRTSPKYDAPFNTLWQ